MNKKTRIGLMILLTVILLLTLTIPGLAKKPADFTLKYEFDDVDWDHYYAEGTFSAIGVIAGKGDAITHWIPRDAKQGTMIFEDQDADEFVIRFTISKYEGNDCSSGHFQILASHGTGKYEMLWGNGDITMCRPDWGNDVYGFLEGWVDQ